MVVDQGAARGRTGRISAVLALVGLVAFGSAVLAGCSHGATSAAGLNLGDPRCELSALRPNLTSECLMPGPNRLAAPESLQCISRVGGYIDPNCLRPHRRADAQAADIDLATGESLLLALPSLPGGYHYITTSDASIVWVEQPTGKSPWGLIAGAREGTAVVTLWTGTQEDPGQRTAAFTVSVHGPATS